jgi:hypothetical protein
MASRSPGENIVKKIRILYFLITFTYTQPHHLKKGGAIFFNMKGTPTKATFELRKDQSKLLHHTYCNCQPKTFSLPPLLLVEISILLN